jgi:hypothetical protein
MNVCEMGRMLISLAYSFMSCSKAFRNEGDKRARENRKGLVREGGRGEAVAEEPHKVESF